MQVICMLKSMHKVYYGYNGQRLNLNALYKAVCKRRGRAKILASVIVTLGTDEQGNEVKGKIVFVRDRNQRKDWLRSCPPILILRTKRSFASTENVEILKFFSK